MVDPEIIKLIVKIGTPIAVLYMVWFHWDELVSFFRNALLVKQPWEHEYKFFRCPQCGQEHSKMMDFCTCGRPFGKFIEIEPDGHQSNGEKIDDRLI